MRLGKQISGPANFSFEYFINKGFISWCCTTCAKKMDLNILQNNLGKPVAEITKDLHVDILNQLIKTKIVNINKNTKQENLSFSKYVLWHINALYSIIECQTCRSNFLTIFGIGEVQPGKEQVQFKGIWELNLI